MTLTTDPVVITGIGIVAPNGASTADYWAAVGQGVTGIGPITRFATDSYRCQLAGEVGDFDPERTSIPRRLVAQTDRVAQFGLATAAAALADSGHDGAVSPPRFGVITSTASGGNQFGQQEIQKLWSAGPRSVGPYQSIAWFYAAITGQVSIRHGLKGHCGVLATEGAGGLDAIGHGRRLLRRGAADALLAGGAEAPISPFALACHSRSGQLSGGRRAEECYLPYGRHADGYVPGEGAAMLTLERQATAGERQAARVYAEVAGYCATHEGSCGDPDPSGAPLSRAIRGALADAGITSSEVDVIFADGSAVPHRDRAEAAALHAVFGDEIPCPVTVPKTMTGRMLAAGAAVDVATAALALSHQLIPPTVLPGDYDSDDRLPLVRTATPAAITHALIVARGHGGFNAAVVLRRT
jgi:act minimal PKS chain-length factor (CLF/KS beta)